MNKDHRYTDDTEKAESHGIFKKNPCNPVQSVCPGTIGVKSVYRFCIITS
jgi:hypothetical protein